MSTYMYIKIVKYILLQFIIHFMLTLHYVYCDIVLNGEGIDDKQDVGKSYKLIEEIFL